MIENVTLDGNQTTQPWSYPRGPSFAAANSTERTLERTVRLVDCTFIARHRPADSVSVILYGTYIERCRFEEAGLADVSYIWHGNTQIGPEVTVAGPHLVWHPDKTGLLPFENDNRELQNK